MTTQMVDANHFNREARRIRARVPVILSKWGLPPKFNRWRLTQDPETGLAVLFAVLNSKYIAAHTSIPFSDYFDPRLLNDLSNDLHMQVVSCNSDGLRYAFILDRGSLGKLQTHIDFPILDGDRLLVGVIYNEEPQPGWINPQTAPAPPIQLDGVDDQTLVNRGVGAFLKVFDDIQQRDEAASQFSAQNQPEVVLLDTDEFKKRVAEHEANRRRMQHIRNLLDTPAG
jgi:hypothetical protein